MTVLVNRNGHLTENDIATVLALTEAGDGGYTVTGDLTIKGISKPISLGFTWEVSDKTVRLHGKGAVKRTDFKIGSGDWEEDGTIGFDVQIVFNLGLQK